jgi:glycosyltransferase involved in cell wall biosynthesis
MLKSLQSPERTNEQTNLIDSCIDLNELWIGEEEQLELSIVMPCLNESETLAMCINRATGFLNQHGIAGEIIVADNGSDDGSSEIAKELGARVATVKKRGYGAALLGGIAAARGKYVIMGDADNSYDSSNLMLFIDTLREGYELVMGNRFRGGIQPGAMPFLHYYLGNPVLTGIGRLFFKSPCRDFHCGLRGFDRKAIETLKLKTTGMEFASEMVVKATMHGLRITEVPTTLDPDGRSRAPHLRSWRDGWRHLRFLLMYSPRWLFLHPGMLLMIAGFLSGVWLIFEPRSIGTATLDIHTLLYSAISIIIGYQAVIFGIFTKVFATTVGLAPRDLRMERLCQIITLEVGLLAGIFLFLGGLAGTLYAFSSWASTAFGPQNPSYLMRVAIPSVLSLALGTQTILSSFFLSILGLKRQHLS